MVAQKVELHQVNDPVTLKRLLPILTVRAQVAIFDSSAQRLREGQELSQAWISKNSLLLQLTEELITSKHIRKKLFLNYPFSLYQTRKEESAKELLSAVRLLQQSQPEFFRQKIEQIHRDHKVAMPILFQSIFQVYLREQHPGEFFVVEIPYLIPGLKEFQGLYLPQGGLFDDLLVFMRDGLLDTVIIPDCSVPLIPVDLACGLLMSNVLSGSAMLNSFYAGGLKWHDFFYIVSDHFTIHPPSSAYAGPEIHAKEEPKKVSIKMTAARIPSFLARKNKNYTLAPFLKELRTTMKLSAMVEQPATALRETEWKTAIDYYIFGLRKYLLADKTGRLDVYCKYGMMKDRYQFRKQSFLHWGLVRGKVQNVNEFDSRSFRERIVNCRKVNDAIAEDLSMAITQNAGLTETDLLARKKLIEADIQYNLDLLGTHFQKLGMASMAMASHYMFRHMFEGIIFDNNFIEFVRNHDYRLGPIIFLPTHKSYMDFMILSYLLVMRDARPPLIGAADNMNNILLISKLFQLSGAFYIKRTGQKYPKVYRAVLNEYLKSVLENEMNLEFFLEASRSRTGQILYPKFGMLKYVVEAYLEKRIPDAVLIPLNITYENLIESDSYIGEHRGGGKVQENTLRVIKAARLIYRNYGKVIINSSEPLSLKKLIDQEGFTLQTPAQEDSFVESLGLRLTDILQDKSVFLQTHLVCALLLMRQHYQLVKDVEANMRLLGVQIKQRQGTVFEIDDHDFNFDTAIKCFRNRLSLRGESFNERRVSIDRANYIENCLALKYYANSMNYLFFLEALVYFAASTQTALEKIVRIDDLWRKVSLLQSLFKKEIFLTKWITDREDLLVFIKSKR